MGPHFHEIIFKMGGIYPPIKYFMPFRKFSVFFSPFSNRKDYKNQLDMVEQNYEIISALIMANIGRARLFKVQIEKNAVLQ